ncbi:MAG: hypothetical protein ACTHXB_08680, partial [Luteimonas sp.]
RPTPGDMERKGLPAAAGPIRSLRCKAKKQPGIEKQLQKKKAAEAAFQVPYHAWEGVRDTESVRQAFDLTWINSAALQHP